MSVARVDMSDCMDALEAAMAAAALRLARCDGLKGDETDASAAFLSARSTLWAARSRCLKMDLELFKMIANHEYASLNKKQPLATLGACMQDRRVHQFVAEQAPHSVVDLVHRAVLRGRPFDIDAGALPASKSAYIARLHASI